MAISQNLIGSIVNPITEARIKLQMSGNSLARRLGLSKQYLSKAEQGTYTNLNPALLLWTSNVLGIDRQKVNMAYWNFQKAQRLRTVEEIGPHFLSRAEGNTDPGHVLFRHWREGYFPSHIAFATAFCLHPETVKSYEDGIRPTMPFPLRQTLTEIGLLDKNWTEGLVKRHRTIENVTEGGI